MMTLPQIPTDNLYKFLSIFGLIIFISSFVYALYVNDKEDTYWDKHTGIISQELADEFKYDDIVDYYNLKRDLLRKEFGIQYSINSSNDIGINADSLELNTNFEKLNQRIDELIKLQDVKYQSYVKYEKSKIDREINLKKSPPRNILLNFFIYISIFIGLILFITGLLLWYFKLQKHLDNKFVNEAINQTIFPIQLKAIRQLNKIITTRIPDKSHEFEEYESFCERIAIDFEKNKEILSNYIVLYYGVLDDKTIESLNSAIVACNEGRINYESSNMQMNKKVQKNVEGFYKNLNLARENIKNEIDKILGRN